MEALIYHICLELFCFALDVLLDFLVNPWPFLTMDKVRNWSPAWRPGTGCRVKPYHQVD